MKTRAASLESSFTSHGRERGVALAISLIMLLLLTVIAVTAMRSSIFELQMSRNEESRINSFEQAQSIVDSVLSDASNLPASTPGDTNCTANVDDCTTNDVTLADELDEPESAAVVTYMSCRNQVPTRLGYSTKDYDSAHFRVDASYDATAKKQGRSALVQGSLTVIPEGPVSACD